MSVDRELFSAGDEFEFKRKFVISFLAAEASREFTSNCMKGWDKAPAPSVEDAEDLACRAWDTLVEVVGVNG